ncbi:DUF3846 domain-containing protein [Butyricicoccus porcorum]|uniref:DUF3846 domain-containing protein n=1 Tax=Butyricicoccus porcorum TaxID=1945634 RepID=A0A252F7B0_9FIRM|nr:DUF3846 domain-containing protein [Butyricicoccus porcorum]MCI6926614.1 DUF3846 domain-containing protein [Butyricicoccus porcorum]MDD6986693.1 DUF3846 domain-containing protein [Butyricicoccus porcorum]MDY4482568.1 DUF3846 domain-containing protein [Butyricicoccus porcorum]OUM21612.1 hypothetical protein CBW42_03350 [Butyricicoccus porcorum]
MDVLNPYIIRALYVRPGEQPKEEFLNGTEAQMEDLVDGRIASIGVDEGICVIHNAFSDRLNMQENRSIYNETFYGPILVVGFDEFGNIISLSDDNFNYYENLLKL